jgi:uncharacterized protein (DUF58 family)
MLLKQILIKTKRQVYSEIAGNNPSIFKGDGFDFVELREYNYGDDIRKIDHKSSAKQQTPYVKIFKEERELSIVIAPILSGSMLFGSSRPKQALCAESASILAYSCAKNGDRFTLGVLTDRVVTLSKATKKLFGVEKIVETILNFQPFGERFDPPKALHELYKSIKRKSIIFLIGDFFDPIDIRKLAAKHEVIVIIIRDHLEENLFSTDTINLLDPENLGQLEGEISRRDIKRYKEALHQQDHHLYTHLRKNGVRFIKIYTHDDPYSKIRRVFL